MRRRFLVPVVLLLVLAGAGWWALGPAPKLAQPALVRIKPGSSRRAIAQQLAQARLLHTAVGFEFWSLLHRGQTLKAGTYRFPGHQSVPEVFRRIAAGQVYTVDFTVPEGYSRFQIAQALGERGLAQPAAFLAATADPSPIRDLDPQAVSLEGYLFPATYRISPGATVTDIVAQMLHRFRQQLRQQRIPSSGVHAWVTLASLVQAETPVDVERPVIAGVFLNRLAKNLPLQCDPTVIYAEQLDGRYSGELHHADLAFASPYNTYLHAGLPPGPIANPGAASLEAAAYPATTDFLYFVSDGHGAHRFARTLSEQQHNVELYRQALAGERR